MGEQQHVANGRRISEQHDQAVDADAHATSRRHAVLQRADVVGVEAHGLVVAHVLGRHLGAEALGLIHRVVQLGEGVAVLVAQDEQLEALSELGVLRMLLRQRRDLQRVVDDEGGLDELLLRHGLEDLGDELALAPSRLGMAAVFLQNGHQLLAAAVEGHLLAGVLAGQLHHGGAAPVAGQIHRRSLVLDLQRAAGCLGRGLDATLGEIHHGVKVAEGLISLHGGELGIVVRIHALVAELTADLEHLLETAHEQTLQRQLRGDAQVVVAIKRVEVRDEGLRVRAADDGMQKRRLYLVVALLLHVAADGRDDLEAALEGGAHLGVHNEIHVALAIAGLLVRQAVELLGQRPQRLAHQLKRVHRYGQLAAAGSHHSAMDGDPVTHIQIAQGREGLLAERVDAAEQLNVAAGLAQLQKRDLALDALGHDTAGDEHLILGGLAVFQVRVLLVQLAYRMTALDRVPIGIDARGNQRLALGAAHLDGIVFDDFYRFGHSGLLVLDLDNGQLDVAAGGAGRRHFVALLAAEQRLTHRRLVGDLALVGVGFGAAHDGEHALAAVHVHGHRGADIHLARALRRVHDGGLGEDAADLGDARLHHALLVLAIVVLGVLRDVAELARHLDALADLGALLGLEVVQLLLELVLALLREDEVVVCHASHLSDTYNRHVRFPDVRFDSLYVSSRRSVGRYTKKRYVPGRAVCTYREPIR